MGRSTHVHTHTHKLSTPIHRMTTLIDGSLLSEWVCVRERGVIASFVRCLCNTVIFLIKDILSLDGGRKSGVKLGVETMKAALSINSSGHPLCPFVISLKCWWHKVCVCIPLSDCGACCTGSHCLAGGSARGSNIGGTCCWSRLENKQHV